MFRKIVQLHCLIGLLLSVVSCSYDYKQGDVAEDLDESKPDIVMEDVSLSFVRGTTVIMNAKKIELYSKRKMQEMSDLTFKEIDSKGEVRMEGKAKSAFVETDTNNVTIVGEFYARSSQDEATIKTKYLTWNDEERRIEGSPTELVTVTRDDESEISGYGFVADAKKRTLSLTKEVQGSLTVDE